MRVIKYLSLLTFLFLFTTRSFTQIQERSSTYGLVHTPKGNLHALIIFVHFPDEDTTNWGKWKYDEIPDFAKPDNNSLFSSEINQIGTKDNLSKWYNDMSMGKFKFTADIFPESIPLKLKGRQSNGNINKEIFLYIDKQYPNYDWSKYDQRKNNPSWKIDNSINPQPDGNLDYVILLYRRKGMGGLAAIQGGYFPLGNYKVSSGYTSVRTNTNSEGLSDLFIHEFGHNLYSSPHIGIANGVLGQYLRGTSAWSMSNATDRVFYTVNAWERWYLGWTEIKYDIVKPLHDTIVEIDDYITTGDAIRIRIPHSNQHLWIENHQKINTFDRHRYLKNAFGKELTNPKKGIYMYVENISPARNSIHSFNTGANGIRVLHPEGNHNFRYKDSLYKEKKWWGQSVYDFYTTTANPIEGYALNHVVMFDYNKDGHIRYNANANHPRSKKNEGMYIFSLNNQERCSWTGEGLAFKAGSIINIATNPMVLPLRKYNQRERLMTSAYLNGLSIKVLSIKEGKSKISIAYNSYGINQKTRWSAQEIIFQADTAYEQYANLELNADLTLAKSQTPAIHDKINGSYNRSTILRIASGNTFEINKDAILRLTDSTHLIIEKEAKLIIEEGAYLICDKQVALLIDENAIINNNGEIILSKKTQVNFLNDAVSQSVVKPISLQEITNLSNVKLFKKYFLTPNTALFYKGKRLKDKDESKIIRRFNKAQASHKKFTPKKYIDFYIDNKKHFIAVRGRKFSYKGFTYKNPIFK